MFARAHVREDRLRNTQYAEEIRLELLANIFYAQLLDDGHVADTGAVVERCGETSDGKEVSSRESEVRANS